MKIGDRVRIKPDGEFSRQAKDHPGLGTITHKTLDGIADLPGQPVWWGILMDDGYSNSYPEHQLIYVGDNMTMAEPDFTLDEIHSAQEMMK